MTPLSQVVVLLLAPLLALAARPPADAAHVVSLEDVTGTTARPASARPSLLLSQIASPGGFTEVGYPEHGPPRGPPRPGQVGGVVSLEDVVGPAGLPRRPGQVGVVSLEDVSGPGHVGHLPPPPPPPYPSWPGADAYRSPCYPSYAAYAGPHAALGSANAVPLGHYLKALSTAQSSSSSSSLSRSRRSPSPSPRPGGVVRLEDVAGPVAARYPAFGPPAYVRPARPYYNYDPWYYGRPRPYSHYPYYPLACIGLFCL